MRRGLLPPVRRPEAARPGDIERRLDDLTKPPGSLGALERVAARLALLFGLRPPPLEPRAVVVMAGDHGVVAQRVSAYPPEVTAQMCGNIASGGAAVSVFARLVGAAVHVVDVGVATPVADPRVEALNVVRGTADASAGPAMRRAQVEAALAVGVEMNRRLGSAKLVGVGEMGIGNTTAAAAISAFLLGEPAGRLVGRGTGIDDASLARKLDAVAAILERLPPDAPPVRVLSEAGGAEIAAMAGLIVAAAADGRAVVLDGFISGAAGLLAYRLEPACLPYLFASHRSAEPGASLQLERLRLEPLLDLGLRLGEGSGAALAFPLLDAAAAMLREMNTFSGAGVSGPRVAP